MSKKNTFVEELKKLDEENQSMEEAEKEVVEEAISDSERKVTKEMEELYSLMESEHGITRKQIEEWKETYLGKVFILRIDDTEAYVYRYLSRPEWKRIIKSFSESSITEEAVNEQIFNKCVLYPTPTMELKQRIGAGTVDTVSYAIKLASNFLPEDVIARSIVKL